MKDRNPIKPERAGTQDWSEADLRKLEEIAPGKPRKAELLKLFPGRTLNAIKLQLWHTRRRLEIPKRRGTFIPDICTTMLEPNDPGVFAPSWQEQQRPVWEQANARYLAALMQQAA
jgi:hypothetical protein